MGLGCGPGPVSLFLVFRCPVCLFQGLDLSVPHLGRAAVHLARRGKLPPVKRQRENGIDSWETSPARMTGEGGPHLALCPQYMPPPGRRGPGVCKILP